jgi:hypothetical protein
VYLAGTVFIVRVVGRNGSARTQDLIDLVIKRQCSISAGCLLPSIIAVTLP